jgi:hypothetical protein
VTERDAECEVCARCGSSKRWYDREPLKLWLPLSAVAATAVQTIAYVGYKLFYNSFGVRPEEVGYDYASLLPRTAFQLALLLAAALLFLCALSLILACYAVTLKPFFSGWSGTRRSTGDRAAVASLAAMVLSIAVAAIVGNRHFWLILCASGAVVLVIDHSLARSAGRPQSSLLSELMTPRIYRGARRMVLLTMAALSATALDLGGLDRMALLLVLVIGLYVADRFVPVVDVRDEPKIRGGGSSPWLLRTMALFAIGGIAFGFVALLSVVLDASHLDRKVAQVERGARLNNDLLDPFTLAEPRAEPVRVRWVAPDPPHPFAAGHALNLTYFGQHDGTSVFLDPRAKPRIIYRVPTSAVELQAGATSTLE